jgi:hypothetical protein
VRFDERFPVEAVRFAEAEEGRVWTWRSRSSEEWAGGSREVCASEGVARKRLEPAGFLRIEEMSWS